ncbi:MAG: glycosyltransferase family 39 protein, partial [Bdellovibrionota bacterium]
MIARDKWERLVFALFIIMSVIRLVLAASLGLGDDEAYYWDWSRTPSLSYFDHPAMVAWLIKLGTLLFGDTSLGVRVFGLVANAIAGVLLWWLARELFDRTVAALALALYTFAPIFAVGGFLMVPDAPMALAWTGFTCVLWKIWGRGRSEWKDWCLAGFVLGFGLLSKYTMILAAVSAVALFFFDREKRRELASWRFMATVAIAIVMCVPILAWNHSFEWPTLKFHLHDRQTGGGGPSLVRWLQFWLSQMVILGPVLFVFTLVALRTAMKRLNDRRWKFIAIVSAPPLLVFAVQALFAEFKVHWPAPAYPLLFISASALWMEWSPKRKRRVAISIFAFFVLIDGVFYVGSISPIVSKISHLVNPSQKFEPAGDPTNDLYGWDVLMTRVQELRAEERAKSGKELFLSAGRYQLVAQLAFVSKEEAWRVVDSTDHYTFTQTPGRRAALKGMDAIFVSDNRFYRDPNSDGVFESCRPMTDA